MHRHLSTDTVVFAALMETERTLAPGHGHEGRPELFRLLDEMARRRPLQVDRDAVTARPAISRPG